MKNRIITLICFWVGLSLCSYPLISSLIERRFQNEIVATYQQEVKQTQNLNGILEQAHIYNRMFHQTDGGVIGEQDESVLSDENYQKQLNIGGNGVMGTIEIPQINVNLPICHGTSEEVISNGVGHFQESSLPVGGKNTRSILTSHRGLPSSKLFTRLDELEKGDLFFLNICGETLAYRIYAIQVMEPEEAQELSIIPEKDIVTLITCTPYGINTHRLVVNGERVSYEKKVHDSIHPQMFSLRECVFAILPFAFSGIMLGIHIKDRKKARRTNVQIKRNL